VLKWFKISESIWFIRSSS